MMEHILDGFLPGLAAAITGTLIFVSTRKRDKGDDRARLFDDALELAASHKQEWQEARQEIEALRKEIEELRQEVRNAIREGEMWRGVAAEAVIEHQRTFGEVPFWWPQGEPLPAGAE